MNEQSVSTTLTTTQIAFFHENGYIAIDRITTDEEVERLRGIYDDLFARKVGRAEGNQFDLGGSDDDDEEAVLPQILGPSRYAPALANTLYRTNAHAIVRQLLGDEADYSGDHAILKPPFSPAPTPWHQDEAYWNPEAEFRSVSVWMPLQDVDTLSGCMEFIPGSHKMEILPHRSIGGDTRVHGLELATEFDPSGAVACPLRAGGATIHLSSTLHYTSPNRSANPRRAYILIFGTPPQKRAEPRRFPWNEEKRTARDERAKAAVENK